MFCSPVKDDFLNLELESIRLESPLQEFPNPPQLRAAPVGWLPPMVTRSSLFDTDWDWRKKMEKAGRMNDEGRSRKQRRK